MPLASIILPCYREKESLEILLPKINSVMSGAKMPYETVIVDDFSGDGTAELVREHSKQSDIIFIQRKEKSGLASAVVEGVRKSRGDYVLVMDADGQHPVEFVPKLLSALSSSDLAVGSRFARGGSMGNFGAVRRLISFGATVLAAPFTRLRTNDPMSGFFAFKKLSVNLARVEGIGYKILLEILATHSSLQVSDVGFVFGQRLKGETKLGAGEVKNYISLLLKLSGKLLAAS